MREQNSRGEVIQESTAAIILRKVPYAGTSAIVTAFTEQFGTMSFMLRGLGKKRSKSAAVQALSLVEIECHYKPSKQVQTITNISFKGNSGAISAHPYKTTVALFLAEVLSKTLREESPDKALFEYVFGAVQYFSEDEFSPDFHLIFLIRLTRFLGFSPAGLMSAEAPYFDLLHGQFVPTVNNSVHAASRKDSLLLSELFQLNFESKRPKWSSAERRSLLQIIVTYYSLHLEGMGKIKSLPILEEVFA